MARAGLGAGWRCLFANDIDPRKGAAYAQNYGSDDLLLRDVAEVSIDDLPGIADLAWASFPCQDLSLAGRGGGLDAGRSGAFWPFWSLIEGLDAEGRAPAIVVIENVCGLLTSRGGRDFAALVDAFARQGYETGALVMDAERFVPQSRPRLFVVGVRREGAPTPYMTTVETPSLWGEARVARAVDACTVEAHTAWRWWRVPAPNLRNHQLADILEPPGEVMWNSSEKTAALLDMMGPVHRAKLTDAQQKAREMGVAVAGTAFRRTRPAGSRIEVRFDGVAGCLRTPAGGSSRQTLVLVEPDGAVRSRLLSGREAARLMGLDDSYVLPQRANDALKLFGDGVAPPVVRHLAEHLLEPMLADRRRGSETGPVRVRR